MKIIYKVGDLMTCDEDILVHGCNSEGVMGSGVAKAIRENYPNAYQNYKLEYEINGLVLGRCYPATCRCIKDRRLRTVVNAISQSTFGNKGVFVCYEAIQDIMKWINEQYCGLDVAFPKIGAGLGGGDWNVISLLMEEESTKFQPVVYTLE